MRDKLEDELGLSQVNDQLLIPLTDSSVQDFGILAICGNGRAGKGISYSPLYSVLYESVRRGRYSV